MNYPEHMTFTDSREPKEIDFQKGWLMIKRHWKPAIGIFEAVFIRLARGTGCGKLKYSNARIIESASIPRGSSGFTKKVIILWLGGIVGIEAKLLLLKTNYAG